MLKSAIMPRVLMYGNGTHDLTDYLRMCGLQVEEAEESMLKALIAVNRHDIYMFCNLPDTEAVARVASVRRLYPHAPLIYISNNKSFELLSEIFENGADDYLLEPLNYEEVICRIDAILRRCRISTRSVSSHYTLNDYEFDVPTATLTYGFEEVRLSARESQVLSLLCAYKNEILAKKTVVTQYWGDDTPFSRRSLDVIVCRLKKAFAPDSGVSIITKRGIGYSLTVTSIHGNHETK